MKNQRGASKIPSRGSKVGGFGCDELVLYGIRELAPANSSDLTSTSRWTSLFPSQVPIHKLCHLEGGNSCLRFGLVEQSRAEQSISLYFLFCVLRTPSCCNCIYYLACHCPLDSCLDQALSSVYLVGKLTRITLFVGNTFRLPH